MMMVLLHSNGQLRTERDGDTEKGCQKPAVQQKTTDDDDGWPSGMALILRKILGIPKGSPLGNPFSLGLAAQK